MAKKMGASKCLRRKKRAASLLDDPKFRERFERSRKKWEKQVQPLMEAAQRSERITEEDLRIVINASA